MEAKYKKLEENSKERKKEKEDAKERLIKENGNENKENQPLKPVIAIYFIKQICLLYKTFRTSIQSQSLVFLVVFYHVTFVSIGHGLLLKKFRLLV